MHSKTECDRRGHKVIKSFNKRVRQVMNTKVSQNIISNLAIYNKITCSLDTEIDPWQLAI